MTYSIIGILAAIILIIINRDVLWGSDRMDSSAVFRNYRYFLFGVLGYLITDMIWGILESYHLTAILYADTVIHFIAMAAAVMLWTRYVISYLDEKNIFSESLSRSGVLFLLFEIIVLTVNFFVPIMFWFDESGGYHAETARYVTLVIQILLFLLTSIYTLAVTSKTKGTQRRRHLTIGVFGIAMVLCIGVQVFYPLLPFYAMGYMLGSCLLHSFVVEDEKEEYREKLEEALERDREQKRELTESREALRDALREAENVSKAKTAFLSNMSHEIRTPMNAIIGLNNIAMDEPTASDKIKEYLGKIDAAAKHLLGVINDILDMSRIESGRMEIRNEEFNFTDCIKQVNTIIEGQCRDKGLIYDYHIEGNIDDYYSGDEMKLKQILINILGNAVKFTPEGGTVSFTVKEGPRFDKKAVLKFIMSDTGIGMDKDFIPHIFDAFSQEDQTSYNKYGSTGLGMSITGSMVELMNGHIDVQSEKGKGTTFTVTITLGASDKVSQSEEAGLNPEAEGDGAAADAGQIGRQGVSQSDGEVADLKGKRVLLAEDVPVNAEIMTLLLTSKEIKVDHAENGRIAVDMFIDHEPGYYDAILMDMLMPEMNGLEATRAIRAMDREDAKTIPVIALTANAFDEDVQRSMQAGLNAHLSKPIEPDELFSTLSRFC